MRNGTKLWLDDVRPPPDKSWTWTRCYGQAQRCLLENANNITHISLDHDLGTVKTGYDVACVVEELAHDGKLTALESMTVHSANPVGVARIRQVIQKVMRP